MTTSSVPDEAQRLQRRTVAILAIAQVLGGIGVASGIAVGALLVAELGAESLSGLASAGSVIGAALIALPVARVMTERGRRPGLLLAYGIGVLGAICVVAGAVLGLLVVALVGLVLTGGGTAAGLQSRYAATDLSAPDRRARALGTVVWATTIGSVLGPNLASPMGELGNAAGVPQLAGPYLLMIAAFSAAAAMVQLFLRPDPLLTARRIAGGTSQNVRQTNSLRAALHEIRTNRSASIGLLAMAVGHAAMVGVMSMTPVHLRHGEASLQVIGLVISVHITGMYVASPVVGIASDKLGRETVIVVGGALLLAAMLVSGTADAHDSQRLGVGLLLLGLGWSCTLIAGSALLTEAVPLERRPNVQGAADLMMGISGASGGLLSGVVVGLGSYALLNSVAALLVVPVIVAAGTYRGRRTATA